MTFAASLDGLGRGPVKDVRRYRGTVYAGAKDGRFKLEPTGEGLPSQFSKFGIRV